MNFLEEIKELQYLTQSLRVYLHRRVQERELSEEQKLSLYEICQEENERAKHMAEKISEIEDTVLRLEGTAREIFASVRQTEERVDSEGEDPEKLLTGMI